MPGAPWMRSGKSLPEHSTFPLIMTFTILPIAFGIGIVFMTIKAVVYQNGDFTAANWFGHGLVLLLGLGVAISLPVVAWQEFKRRKRGLEPEPTTPKRRGRKRTSRRRKQ